MLIALRQSYYHFCGTFQSMIVFYPVIYKLNSPLWLSKLRSLFIKLYQMTSSISTLRDTHSKPKQFCLTVMVVAASIASRARTTIFTHPIFESDFDCLTGKNHLHHLQSLLSLIASDKHKSIMKSKHPSQCMFLLIYYNTEYGAISCRQMYQRYVNSLALYNQQRYTFTYFLK